MTVLVGRRHGEKYHKPNDEGDEPRCMVTDVGDLCEGDWKEWDKGMADAWKEPCQNPGCYGEKPDSKEGALG